jgi:RNA polymerase sigma-70 factor (ECF subfamily)
VADAEGLEKHLESVDPDVRLMLRVREDDRAAFEELVERYQHRLLGVLTHLVGSQQEAEDLAQDVFLRIYRARKGYRARAKFSTWLFTVANNVALNHLRGRGRHTRLSGESSGDGGMAGALPARDGTASAQMRHAELSEMVREAVAHLDDDQRLAVLLSKFEEMSYAQIAEVMKRSEAAVKSLLARARVNLRTELEPYLRTGERAPGGQAAH